MKNDDSGSVNVQLKHGNVTNTHVIISCIFCNSFNSVAWNNSVLVCYRFYKSNINKNVSYQCYHCQSITRKRVLKY